MPHENVGGLEVRTMQLEHAQAGQAGQARQRARHQAIATVDGQDQSLESARTLVVNHTRL